MATSIKAVRGFTRSYSECSVGEQLHVATQACDAALPMLIYKCSDSLTSFLRCTPKTAQYTYIAVPHLQTQNGPLHITLPSLQTQNGPLHITLPSLQTQNGPLHIALPSLQTQNGPVHIPLHALYDRCRQDRHRHIHNTVSPHGT